jgi:CMP-N-acetylneuraminic acid synthetase
LEEVVRETGAVYGFRTKQFLRAKSRFFGTIGVVMIPSLRALEIDSPEDLEMARRVAPLIDEVCDVARKTR